MMILSRRLVAALVPLSLGSLSGRAQTLSSSPPTVPTERRTIVGLTGVGAFLQPGLGLSYERVLTRHLTVGGRVFLHRHAWQEGSAQRINHGIDFGPTIRWYFTGRAPQGLYAEAGIYGRYTHYRATPGAERADFGRFTIQPELGAGYQFFIGQRHRVTADLGLRLRLLHDRQAATSGAENTLLPIPTLKFGFAF